MPELEVPFKKTIIPPAASPDSGALAEPGPGDGGAGMCCPVMGALRTARRQQGAYRPPPATCGGSKHAREGQMG
ncbi:hypothetical protein GCM10010392_04350 [Streptomyces clavifer]|nr:hypothetical protein GCM10010392_04350 [Streptomyces clavifer]